jgi:P4 family phage/plasmid primase-like protien
MQKLELETEAKALIAKGLKVVPLWYKSGTGKGCHVTAWGVKNFSPEQIVRYLRTEPDASIGVQMGPVSRIVDFEYDSEAQRDKIAEIFGGELPTGCPLYKSANGAHYWFAYDPRLAETNYSNLPIKLDNGETLIVRLGACGASQSEVPPGHGKQWLPGRSIHEIDPPALPESVVEHLLAHKREPLADDSTDDPDDEATAEQMDRCRQALADLPDAISGHGGHDVTLRAACDIRRHRIYGEQAFELLQEWNAVKCSPGWTDNELRHKLNAARQFVPVGGNEFDIVEGYDETEAPKPRRRFALTDLGNAERFADHHQDNVRFVPKTGERLAYVNGAFAPDDRGHWERYAKQTVRSIYREAAAETDDTRRGDIGKHAKASESRSRIEAMIALAQSEAVLVVSPSELDARPELLNCLNGTVNLHTGKLQPHNRADLLTKNTGVLYPTTPGGCPIWESFVDTIFDGDDELISFVQRLLGYSFYGEVRDNILAVLHGNGANGKSTLIETILAAAGDYGSKAPHTFLMSKRNESHPTDVARLKGVRIAVISESGDGKALNESLVKELTGGDTITARKLYQDNFEFRPSHTFLMATNHRPLVQGTDLGLWRRLRLIPFVVTIPEAKQDPALREKLRGELPGILRWCVDGCLEWQRVGLNPPAAVMAATEAYRADSDSFRGWWSERVEPKAGFEVKASEAYSDYQAWCHEQDECPVSAKTFGGRVLAMSGIDRRHSSGKLYTGFRLEVATENVEALCD